MCFTLKTFGDATMKTKNPGNCTTYEMHEKCRQCTLKNHCNVWKHYKKLTESGNTNAANLVCYMQTLDRDALCLYKYLEAGQRAFIERRVKLYCMQQYEIFGKLWKLYEKNDKSKLTQEQNTEILVYCCRILERYGELEFFEIMLDIDLSTDYDNFIKEVVKEENRQNEKND